MMGSSNENSPERPQAAGTKLDAGALRAKYLKERDKRIRPDAVGQYREVAGSLAGIAADPNANPAFHRPPLAANTDVLVIGGGFGGLLAAARLRDIGVEDIRIVERGADFGGTWYWNRYPNAACDIESYIYLPLLEEVGYFPTEKYAKGPEIFAHAQRIGRHYGLYNGALFQTEATDLTWDESQRRWVVSTDREDRISARFVVVTSGSLETPKLPGIPGIETFDGQAFHTSRWDYSYTGGGPTGELSGLSDKRVGIVGTGATAIQAVPPLADSARQLFVFQRTPCIVGRRDNRPTDWEWAASLRPGWQQRRMENFNNLVSLSDVEESDDLVGDGWTDVIGKVLIIRRRMLAEGHDRKAAVAAAELADLAQMEEIRARIDAIVEDKATAAALKPYYDYFCKRPTFHDEYLAAFNRPNVTLVDTDGRGIDRITPAGVVVGGEEIALDCLIYATGFEFGGAYQRGKGARIAGRGGVTLAEKWQGGVSTFHGLQIGGFPNLFLFSRAQTGVTTNITHMLGELAIHVAHIVGECRNRGVEVVDAERAAENDWVAHCESSAVLRRKFFEQCTPSYFNNEGNIASMTARNAPYGPGPNAFIRCLRDWRARGDLQGLRMG